MKKVIAGAALALIATTGLGACGGHDVTSGRLDDAIGPAFAHLWSRQQQLLGKGAPTDVTAAATCARSGKSAAASNGAGDDWVCQLQLQRSGPTSSYTYEVSVRANGCYSADGSPSVVGQRLISTPGRRGTRTNPLFAFDGCFDTT